ncbi:hypothetical protein GCM10010524_39440 [Streptomyces mexicanus]
MRELLRELLPDERARSTGGRTGPVQLRSITAAGRRGIGPRTTLELPPGPGLVVVAGPNGSGKSSFAEAAETAITGRNSRWAVQVTGGPGRCRAREALAVSWNGESSPFMPR